MVFKIIDIFKVKRIPETAPPAPRHLSTLALRISAKTIFHITNEKFTANDGSITYLPSGLAFERISEDNEELIVIHLKVFGDEEKNIQVFNISESDKIIKLFHLILDEWKMRKSGYEHRCTSILHNILEQIEIYAETTFSCPEQQILKNGIIYMNTHFDEPGVLVSTLAKKCNISEVYFRRLYKKLFGISPVEAIRKLKIERACQLLSSGYFNVNETAEKVGFVNTKHFSTVFKKETGMTPTDYLRNNYSLQKFGLNE